MEPPPPLSQRSARLTVTKYAGSRAIFLRLGPGGLWEDWRRVYAPPTHHPQKIERNNERQKERDGAQRRLQPECSGEKSKMRSSSFRRKGLRSRAEGSMAEGAEPNITFIARNAAETSRNDTRFRWSFWKTQCRTTEIIIIKSRKVVKVLVLRSERIQLSSSEQAERRFAPNVPSSSLQESYDGTL